MKLVILCLALGLLISGCAMSNKTNMIEVQKGAIFAHGEPSRGIELLNGLVIDLSKLSHEDRTNLWIEFADNKKMTLSDISFEEVKSRATKEHINPENNMRRFYYIRGYSFEFIGKVPTSLQANKYGFPPSEKIAYTRIGTFSKTNSLTLPCTLNQFEEVFGRSDEVRRWWSL